MERLGYLCLLVHGVALIAFTIASGFDDRSILGLNPWIKPIKFAISILIFVATLIWLFSHLSKRSATATRKIMWIVTTAMYIETGLIALQSARGVASHFNQTSLFNSLVFMVMGIAISISTLAVAYSLRLFRAERECFPSSFYEGIVFGIWIFLLASAEGGYMGSRLTHTIHGVDGGPGLPFVNWSIDAGDMRIAHFAGLHALQVLPILGWWLGNRRHGSLIIGSISALYFVMVVGLFVQAMLGQPF